MAVAGYAGDVSTTEAWAILEKDPKAQLVDVRTTAEWNFVGVPDLADVAREVLFVEWQNFPQGARNPNFVSALAEKLTQAGVSKDTPLLFLCWSGGRSRAAAIAMTESGFTKAYNVAGGFEGDRDEDGHRGNRGGWKSAGLPWQQG